MVIKSSACFIFSSLLLFSVQLHAQYYNYGTPLEPIAGNSEVRLHVGATAFLGDLGGGEEKGIPLIKDINFKTIRPFFGVSYGFFLNEWLNVNAGVNLTRVNGADSLTKGRTGKSLARYLRNLSFQSDIFEANAAVELYPAQLIQNYEDAKLRPYVGVGIGVFHFNPIVLLGGQKIELQPLHLEGQGFAEYPERKNYKLTQLYVPVTAGIRYRLTDNFMVSASAVFRKTFTDYIDDVSTRYIDPALFDKYLSANAASLARQLNFRKILPPDIPYTGKKRGESGSKDSYVTVFFTLSYLFSKYY